MRGVCVYIRCPRGVESVIEERLRGPRGGGENIGGRAVLLGELSQVQHGKVVVLRWRWAKVCAESGSD